MVVLALAIPLGLFFDLDHEHVYSFSGHNYGIGPQYLVHLPGSILKATAFPDFSAIATSTSIKYIVMFTLIGSIESILSALAVDTLDPERKPSNLNRDLFALGVANLVGAFIGALPVISEIVRSKANVDAGAKSPRANFSHAAILLLFVVALPALLSEIPLASLAAILVFVGFRLASPKEFHHVYRLGFDQLAVFIATLVVTLASDLLVGVACGFALELILNAARGATPLRMAKTKVERFDENDVVMVRVRGVAAFPCLVSLQRSLSVLSPEIKTVRVDLSETAFVDHTFLSRLHGMAGEWPTATHRPGRAQTHERAPACRAKKGRVTEAPNCQAPIARAPFFSALGAPWMTQPECSSRSLCSMGHGANVAPPCRDYPVSCFAPDFRASPWLLVEELQPQVEVAAHRPLVARQQVVAQLAAVVPQVVHRVVVQLAVEPQVVAQLAVERQAAVVPRAVLMVLEARTKAAAAPRTPVVKPRVAAEAGVVRASSSFTALIGKTLSTTKTALRRRERVAPCIPRRAPT
jgi:MFS superfamily sulfate permease-like transporter